MDLLYRPIFRGAERKTLDCERAGGGSATSGGDANEKMRSGTKRAVITESVISFGSRAPRKISVGVAV